MVKKFILRNVAMLLSLVMLISSTAQTTYGFISVVSDPLVNTFVPDEYVPSEETDSVEIFVKKTVENIGKGEISPSGFSFYLTENKTGLTKTAISDGNGEAKIVLEFDEADIGKTFEYSLYEKDFGKEGVIYSDEVYSVTVAVERDAEGKAEAKIVSSETGMESKSASFEFENEYNGDAVFVNIVAQKEFAEGSQKHSLKDFVFVLGDEEKTTGDDGRAAFDIEITEAGTFTYEIYEKNLGEEGMVYDASVKTVEIVATEQNGKLSVSVNEKSALSATETFVNVYNGANLPPLILALVNLSVNAEVSIANDKTPPTALDQFEIVGDGISKITDAEGRTSFDIEVDGKIGDEFEFKFFQKPGDIEGLIYDETENILTLKFVDDGRGDVTVEIYINGVLQPSAGDLTVYFVNRYEGEIEENSDSVEISVKKTVENTGSGKIGPAGFTFNLNGNGENLSAVSDGNGDAKFVLEFDESDVGNTYTYTLSEQNDGKENVTYSEDVHEITVEVIKNEEGKTDARIVDPVTGKAFESAEFGFTNIYNGKAVSVSVIAQKAFSAGSDEHSLSGFVFVLGETEKTSGDDGKAVFDLEFTEAGTFTYEIYEKNLGEEGMTYDATVGSIEVVVTENEGVLSAEIAGVEGNSITATFTNTYKKGTVPPPPVSGKTKFTVNAEVSIVNDTDPATALDQFEIVGPQETKTTDEEGKTSFDIEVEGEIGEEFTYKFYQKPGDIENLVYDESENIIVVKFVDDGYGNAVAEIYVNGVLQPESDEINIYFVNRYPGLNEAYVTVEVEKFITNNSGTIVPANVNFTFNLTDKETGEVIDFVNITGTGRRSFNRLAFGEEDIGTHYYTVTEVNGNAEGFEYSTEVYDLSVSVTKNRDGKVVAKVLMNGIEKTLATFTNIYNGPEPDSIKLPITITKEIVGGNDKINPEQFEFIIENLTEGTSKKVRTNAQGVFANYLEFDADDAGKTVKYRVKELRGSRKDIEYDQTVYDVSVKVENVGGVLKATVSVNGFLNSGDLNFAFRNIYKGTPVPPPSEDAIIVPIVIEKTVISGGDKKMGPADFEFVLEYYAQYNENNYCEYERTDINGKATFNLVFDREDVDKTYEFRVYETNDGIPGVKYDETVYEIELSIYRDELGRIAAGGYIINGDEETYVSIDIPEINDKEETEETEETEEKEDDSVSKIVLKFVNEYDVFDEGNPETGIYMIAEGIAAMIFSGIMFVLLVLTDKRFKIK